ncbi:MAG TPA: hypothetical protein VFZ20_11490 [Longimicrobium sp.]|nr:hypothetical protein [Longimicrobium sp.]
MTERLLGMLEQFAAFSRDRRDFRDNALRSISTALNETYLYYRDLGQGKPRDYDIEAQLSRYWSAAAIPIRHIDPELAGICEHKSEYWINPDQWTSEEVRQRGIELGEVRDRYRALLWPHFAKARDRAILARARRLDA